MPLKKNKERKQIKGRQDSHLNMQSEVSRDGRGEKGALKNSKGLEWRMPSGKPARKWSCLKREWGEERSDDPGLWGT